MRAQKKAHPSCTLASSLCCLRNVETLYETRGARTLTTVAEALAEKGREDEGEDGKSALHPWLDLRPPSYVERTLDLLDLTRDTPAARPSLRGPSRTCFRRPPTWRSSRSSAPSATARLSLIHI